MGVNCMFTACVGLVFRSKYVYVQFPIICSFQYSINFLNTVEVDTHSDLLHICIVKPKNWQKFNCMKKIFYKIANIIFLFKIHQDHTIRSGCVL